MSLYFIILLGTIAGPLFLSFDKKVHFYTYWRYIFFATFIVAIPYIIWDVLFAEWGIWGFNTGYLQGINIGNLPLEEISFFLLVPYAFLFIHECLNAYFPKLQAKKVSSYFAYSFSTLCLVMTVLYFPKLYTSVVCLLALVLTGYFFFYKKVKWYPQFILAFFIVQIPFFFVNGAITGMFTPEPIVWYNEAEIVGLRWVSIPMEDSIYNYGFLILVFYFYQKFKKKAL